MMHRADPPEILQLSVVSPAQLPTVHAVHHGEEIVHLYHISHVSSQKKLSRAELCPGCNCPMKEKTDYQLSGRDLVVKICKDCNKHPSE